MDLLSWIIAIFSLAGVILNTHKNKWCFVIWIFTNGFWCVFDLCKGLYSQSLLFFIYFCLAIYGFFKWKINAK